MKKKKSEIEQKNRKYAREDHDALARATRLIEALYNDDTSETTRKSLVEWFRSGYSDEAKYRAFENAMNRYLQPNEHPDQTDAAEFHKLKKRLGLETSAMDPVPFIQTKRKLAPARIAMRVAAVLLPVVIAAGACLWYIVYSTPNEVHHKFAAAHHISVPENDYLRLTLDDGTDVVLNEESEFSYDQKRECELHGEAYFKVAKSDKPFVIHAGKLSVTVLGTEFNLSAYDDSELSTVTLYSGSVKIDYECGTRQLEPGMEFTYNSRNHAVSLTKVNVGNEPDMPSWMEDKELFQIHSLGDIFSDIEAAYGVTIENKGILDTTELYSFRFRDGDSLDVLMSSLRDACGKFKYSIQGKTIILETAKN